MAQEAMEQAQVLVWDPAGLACADVQAEPEGSDYCAQTLTLGGRASVFRTGKATPTKAGHFVTLWVRSQDGPIRPFDVSDGVQFFIVNVTDGERLGQFVFPAAALVKHGVVSVGGRGGKRAIRVYAPWVMTTSAQARRTQAWQCEYFLPLDGASDTVRARELYLA
jgi:hypothetical protein